MSKRPGGVSWIKNSEPKFIREFKERIAYKEQANTQTKKKKLDNDLLVEKEEDLPQVVQLKSGDLGEKEYLELKSKEDIQNSASSFGKILFKKPKKKVEEEKKAEEEVEKKDTEAEGEAKKKSEIELIFNLNKEGVEEKKEEVEELKVAEEAAKKKIYLDQEENVKYGLQEGKQRFVDRASFKNEPNLSAKKIRAKEAKQGNKKLLSFYDEEQEEAEEFEREKIKEEGKKAGEESD